MKRHRVSLRIESKRLEDIRALAKQRKVTLTSLFEAGIDLLLAKVTREGSEER